MCANSGITESGIRVIDCIEKLLDEFNKTFTYRKLPIFLEVATYSPWSNFLRLNETACEQNLPSCVRDFIFVIGFHNVIRFNDLIAPVREWREIAQKYSDMGLIILIFEMCDIFPIL